MHRPNHLGRRLLVALSGLIVASTTVPLARAADPTAPTLRLFTARKNVTIEKYRKRAFLDLGVWATAEGGAFELKVARADYDSPIAAAQVDPVTGAELRSIPTEMLDGWSGLARFFNVTMEDASGAVVAQRVLSFCPNSWERQRIDDEGPTSSRYPQQCSAYSPFTKGMVWGIDEHWAVGATSYDEFSGAGDRPYVRVPAGDYTATVEVAPEFAELLGIPPDHASVTVGVTVVEAGHGRHLEGRPRSHAGVQPARVHGVPTVSDPDPDTLPDLVALPTWSMGIRSRRTRDFLTFASTPWNAGPRPLVVEGFRRPEEDVMDAYQYFRDEDGDVVGRAPVGELEFDDRRGHNHWHFLQFVSYTLLDSSGKEVVKSKKQSFCLAPTDPIDLTVEGANWSGYREDLTTACGSRNSIWVREVLEAGWGDTYFQSAAGQAFNITDVPNGWYYVRVHVDPLGVIYQKDKSNDIETRLVYLGGKPGARRVKVAPWHGITD